MSDQEQTETPAEHAPSSRNGDTRTEPPPPPPPREAQAAEDVDGVKRALDQSRKEREKLQRQLDDLRKQSMSEAEKAVAEAKAEGRKAALAEVSSRLLTAEVRALAADRMADPADAVHLLDLEGLVDDDGHIDSKAIVDRLEALLKDKPYLAKAGKPAALRAPHGARDDGAEKPSGDAFIRRAVRHRRSG